MLYKFFSGTRALFRRRQEDAELSEELRVYIETAAEEKIAAGIPREEAQRAARAELGSAEAVKDDVRDAGWESRLYSVGQDLRYALRVLKNSPGFTLVTAFSLALAIGANTALFSLFDAVFLKKLPVRDPGRLVVFDWEFGSKEFDVSFSGNCNRQQERRTCSSFPSLALERMRAANRTLDDIFAFYPIEQMNVNVAGRAEIADGQVVSGDYFRGLDAPIELGRAITPEDDRTNAAPVAVISHAYWQKRFGGDPGVAGRTVQINNVAFTIVGVTGPGFVGAFDEHAVDVSLPLTLHPLISPEAYRPGQLPVLWWLRLMGRRKPGITLAEVQANLAPVFHQAAWDAFQMGPIDREDANFTFADAPTLESKDGSGGLTDERVHLVRPMMILLAMVGLILLIACANVANMLLAKSEARQREIAIRLAIGAGRFRVARQLLTESVLLACIAGLLGTLLAFAVRNTLSALVPGGNIVEIDIDWRVLTFTVAASLLTGLVFGMAPALRAMRRGFDPALKEATRSSMGRRGAVLGKALVVVQVALSVVLLIAAGLFVRTLRNLKHVDVGFDTRNLLMFRVDPRLSGYKGNAIQPVYHRLMERLSAVPGVKAVTASRHPLLARSTRANTIHIGDRKLPSAFVNVVEPGFFETMGIPIVAGRGITDRDEISAPHVAVINAQAARRYFGNQDPIGHRIGLGWNNVDWFDVVGIARSTKYYSVRQAAPATVYIALTQDEGQQANFELRTALDPTSLIPAVRAAVHEVDSNLPIFEVKTQVAQAEESIAQERLYAELSSGFGALALILAAIGLFGLMSYAVARRTNEIAIRMALGARQTGVLGMVIGETLVLVLAGAAIGIPCAVGVATVTERVLTDVLYGVTATDPVTFSVTAIGLLVIGVVAAYIPAHRAARVDPMRALRYE
jgi:predicted permease